jgi:hypothetical protein
MVAVGAQLHSCVGRYPCDCTAAVMTHHPPTMQPALSTSCPPPPPGHISSEVGDCCGLSELPQPHSAIQSVEIRVFNRYHSFMTGVQPGAHAIGPPGCSDPFQLRGTSTLAGACHAITYNRICWAPTV